MNEVSLYTLLEKNKFSDEDAKAFIQALKNNSDYSSKEDINVVKADIKNLEIRMMQEFLTVQREINGLLGKTLAGTAAIIAVATFIIKLGA